MDAKAILDGFTEVVKELPAALNLGEQAANFVVTLVKDFEDMRANPNATQADIDALVTDIKARSAQIQAID